MATVHQPSIAALKRQRTRRLARLGAKVYYLRKRGKDQQLYDLVCEEFVSLGGVYIKFLQGVLFNSPVMRRWHSPNRLKIFEDVESEPMDVISILRDELRPEQLQQIALIQQEPFAAGSFGQVYLGQHVNGKRVVVKVLRPMIRELLRYDLRLLGLFSKRFAAKQYENIHINMNTAVKEFRIATLNETDYGKEAHFARDLYEAYKDHPTFVIPETYLDLCTQHVIVQEYVEGVSGAELLKLKESGGDPVAYVREQNGSDLIAQMRTLGIESLAAAFSLPRVQGDPHPGNVRYMSNDRVGLIDFGISAPAPLNRPAFFGILEEWSHLYQEQGNVASLFEQFLRFFVNDLYRSLKKLSTLIGAPLGMSLPMSSAPAPSANASSSSSGRDLMKEVGRIAQTMFDSAVGTRDVKQILDDGRMMQAFGQIINKDNRFGLIIHLESSEILRAAQTYISQVESFGLRNEVIPQVLAEVVRRVSFEHPDLVHQTDHPVSTARAISIVNRWLERVAVKDPALFRQLLSRINLNKVIHMQSREETTDAQGTAPIH
ncbi:MAG TPA: AarF/ABC1/UbiB kinase family protein [Candidatus Saccharimonadales bacterium]|jgi:hypothetical protein|nr:AarF/ABC1/UbiB kinase family protein [Candidatus Saccharimonadales bacterium]